MIKANKTSFDAFNNVFILYIFLFVKEGKYTDKIAIKIQKRILNNVLTNKVKYEKLYKLIMICVKPTYAEAETPKKIQTWRYENNLNAFAYVLIKYEAKQKRTALWPKNVFEIKSINSPVQNASIGPILFFDLYI